MSDVKISNLPASTTPLGGTEVLPVVQGSTTKKVSVANLTAGRDVSALSVTATGLTASSAVATDANKKLVSVTNTGTGNNVLASDPTVSNPLFLGPSGTVTDPTYQNQTSVKIKNNFHNRVALVNADPATYESAISSYGPSAAHPTHTFSCSTGGKFAFLSGDGTAAPTEKFSVALTGDTTIPIDKAYGSLRASDNAYVPMLKMVTGTNTTAITGGFGAASPTSTAVSIRNVGGSELIGVQAGGNTTVNGSVTASSFIPTSSTAPTNGIYLSSANNLAFSTNSAFAMVINSSQELKIGSGNVAGKLGVYGDSLTFSPSADSDVNGIGCAVLGNNVANTTAGSAKMYMTGGNAAHAGRINLRSGSVVDSAILMYNTTGTQVVTIGVSAVDMLPVYDATVGATNRDVYVDNTGRLGYVSSTRESKTNIQNINDVSWIKDLNPVTFNRKKKKDIISDDEFKVKIGEEYTNEHYDELEYGLIAEEVELVNDKLCFYDQKDGDKRLAGIHYSKLVVPLLKMVQQQNEVIESLKERISVLEAK